MKMELTKRQEKQLNKIYDDPKKLRKWIDEVYTDMNIKCDEKNKKTIQEYLDVYSIAVAYTLHYVCGFGKKRLPEVMERIWNNVESFQDGYLKLNDCIKELKDNGIVFDEICEGKKLLKLEQENKEKLED